MTKTHSNRQSLRIFQRLTQLSDFRRGHLPFIQTLGDLDLLREIGLHQMQGRPTTLKELFLKGIASVATVQRRLNRLKRLGVISQSRAEHDKRLVRLTISPPVWRVYRYLDRLMVKTR